MKVYIAILLLSLCCAAFASHSARVRFNSRGIRGYITFTEQENGNVRIVANLAGLRGEHVWHVHSFPVDQSLDPAVQCDIEQLGPPYDPFGYVSSNPTYVVDCQQNQSFCAVGDFANKFGPLPSNGQLDVMDTTGLLSLTGRYSIVGRGLIIHASDDPLFPPLECGTIRLIEEVEGAQVTLLQATFISPIAGTIYMRQVGTRNVEIFGKLYWVNDTESTVQHNWHIHEGQPTEGYLLGYDAGCSEVGPPLDLPNTVVGENSCSQDTPNGCIVGDLVGKHGPLDVAARPAPYIMGAFFFTDPHLNLTDVRGRAVVVHMPNEGGPGVACAPLATSENYTLTAAGPQARFIQASQSGPFEDTIIIGHGVRGEELIPLKTNNITLLNPAFSPTSTVCAREDVYSPYDCYTDGEGVATPDRYDLGDWMNRYGDNLTAFNSFNVFDVPIYGANSMAAHTMRSVINSTSRICSSWTPMLGGPGLLRARAVFSGSSFGPIEGVIYFFQRDFGNSVLGQTLVVVDIYYSEMNLNTTGHNWHVHQTPPVDGTVCVDTIGGHYNPFSVSLGTSSDGEATNSDYGPDCSPTYPLRCESGDLSGKHGQLRITSDGNFYPTYAYLDPNLRLTGDYSIVGRSIGLHNFTGPLFDCAAVAPFALSTNILSFTVDAGKYSRNELARLLTSGTDVKPSDVFIAGGQDVYKSTEAEVECIGLNLRILGETQAEADANYDAVSQNVDDNMIRCSDAKARARASMVVSAVLLGLCLLVALFSN